MIFCLGLVIFPMPVFFGYPFSIFSLLFLILGVSIISKIVKNIHRNLNGTEQKRRIMRADDFDEFINSSEPQQIQRKNRAKLEVSIFRLADKRKGRITVSDIVLETGLSVQEAEDVINNMVDEIHVKMDVMDNGSVIYDFPEIASRYNSK